MKCVTLIIGAPVLSVNSRRWQGMAAADAIRRIGVSEVTYDRWRKEYGGMGAEQLKRPKELEKENQRLRRAVSDLTLDKLILSEAAKGSAPAAAKPYF